MCAECCSDKGIELDFPKSEDKMEKTHVGGVPAKEICKRFAPEVIKKLMEIQWWNWAEDRIRSAIKAIQSGNFKML